jgi:hypothetical protein
MSNDIEMHEFEFLQALRKTIGPPYGSEDLCMLMYSIVKRERPAVVVELGTGVGVTTAWIAAAMKENGFGQIFTFDNGSHFDHLQEKYAYKELRGVLEPLAASEDYGDFLRNVFRAANVAEHVKFRQTDFDLDNLSWLDEHMAPHCEGNARPVIDILFSDYNHSAANTAMIVGTFLPRMAEVSSIFVDSASTHMGSYLMLERIVQILNNGRVPKEMVARQTSAEDKQKLLSMVSESEFKLMHLVERRERKQNSTAWLRIERASLTPPMALCLH